MIFKLAHKVIILSFVSICSLALIAWLWYDPVKDFEASIPGLDNRPEKGAEGTIKVTIGEYFREFENTVFETNVQGSTINFFGVDAFTPTTHSGHEINIGVTGSSSNIYFNPVNPAKFVFKETDFLKPLLKRSKNSEFFSFC